MVKDYLQYFKIEFDQLFAIVIKLTTLRVLFAIVAFFNLDIDLMDIKTVFWYCLIDQLVCVDILKKTELASIEI